MYFWLNLSLAFLIGGTAVALATVVADRFGSRVGGLFAALPFVGSISFFFLALNEGTSFIVPATNAFPFAVGFSGIYLLVFAILSRKTSFGG